MNINNNNGKGQEQVVTYNRLDDYRKWLNSTLGASFLKVTSGTTSTGRYMLTFTSTLGGFDANGNPYMVEGDDPGLGTIYWARTTSGTQTTTKTGAGSIVVSGNQYTSVTKGYPRGKVYLEYNNRKFTELDNTDTSDYTGYETLNIASIANTGKCIT